MKARNRPNIVEAFRYGIDAVPDWFQDMLDKHDAYILNGESAMVRIAINDEAFWCDVKHGYVVVKDANNLVYALEPAVFGLMFEVVRR